MACRRNSQAAYDALNYLLSAQNADGGWATKAGAQPSDWTSGLALLAVQVLGKTLSSDSDQKTAALLNKCRQAVADGAIYLLRSRADFITEASRIGMFLINGTNFDYPRGWSWTPNTFNWVEPTAYAVLAIKMSPLISNNRYQIAIQEAHKYYIDKICSAGGWNYGAPLSVGTHLPPQIVPTAMALMAMNDVSDPRLAKSISYLNETNDVTTSTLHAQALSILALHAHRIDVKERVKHLQEQFALHQPVAQNLLIAGMCSVAIDLPSHGNPLIAGSSA
jgi:hypothetical protein